MGWKGAGGGGGGGINLCTSANIFFEMLTNFFTHIACF